MREESRSSSIWDMLPRAVYWRCWRVADMEEARQLYRDGPLGRSKDAGL